MNVSKTKRLVTASLMVAMGMLFPFVISHGYGLKGTIFLPMHIPVLLCGFFAGPLYGSLCGLILPVLNSVCTGMPELFPMAVIMTGELFTYGLVSGFLYKKTRYTTKLGYLYPVLIISMLCGRVVYGLVSASMLFLGASVAKLSVIAAAIQGLPGIVIQLIIIPPAVKYLSKNFFGTYGACDEAIALIKSNKKTCVVVKRGRIVSAKSPMGIHHIISLYELDMLKDAFVADTIIGKAAAMIFSLAGVNSCYGKTVSEGALKWLEAHKINVTYDSLTDVIQNRKGDGMCPMEETVWELTDESEALKRLKAKVEELSATNN